jgi:hypothetical protein
VVLIGCFCWKQQGGSLLSSSVSHSAPAPSPNGQCTSVGIIEWLYFSWLYGFISDFFIVIPDKY